MNKEGSAELARETGHQPATIQEMVDIATWLQRKGIWVPRISAVDYKNQIIEFEPGGKTQSAFNRSLIDLEYTLVGLHGTERNECIQKIKAKQKILAGRLAKIFRMIGRVQAAGVIHGHPHFGNIVFRGNQVGLVDFKLAERINWNALFSKSAGKPPTDEIIALRIVNAFTPDYHYLSRIIKPLNWGIYRPKWTKAEIKKMVGRLVQHYPCSNRIKELVATHILEGWFAEEIRAADHN
ncbi:hypothetical protein KKE06_04600 [Candidatus Micrarchaeota archaeon]|nr:hypothetical protein [Candidatus Micrarchaeota archaeon]MBU1930537.1 hypothetical protein [Candidatus Micrarchaeota archaeon]